MAKKNDQPRITVNKLGEYLVTSASNQRKLLRTLKYPKEEGGGWGHVHSEARVAIKEYFVNNFDKKYIKQCIVDLKEKKEEGNEKHYHASSILLLKRILNSDLSKYKNFNFETHNFRELYLHIEGVRISVAPDLLVTSSKRGNDYIGALQVHLVKKSELNDMSGKYISAVLYRFVDEFVQTNRINRHDHNISYDVIFDRFVECPKSVVRIWNDIEAGCKNIAAIWGSI